MWFLGVLPPSLDGLPPGFSVSLFTLPHHGIGTPCEGMNPILATSQLCDFDQVVLLSESVSFAGERGWG